MRPLRNMLLWYVRHAERMREGGLQGILLRKCALPSLCPLLRFVTFARTI